MKGESKLFCMAKKPGKCRTGASAQPENIATLAPESFRDCEGRPQIKIERQLKIEDNRNMDKTLIESIRNKLAGPLPGKEAHFSMSHVGRFFKPAPATAQKAGVLILLFPKDGEWHIALTQRASKYANDKHKGQMSFPGGKMEAMDDSLITTALRETEEEIGVPRESITILGELTPFYIPVSNFVVQPVVGLVERKPSFVLEENEVTELVSESVARLCSDKLKFVKDISISKQLTLKRVPYFDVEGKVVWGATAMMLNEFVTLLKQNSSV